MMADTSDNRLFAQQFEDLTGCEPLSWQTRFYKRFAARSVPEVIDLPTGLGKTMVMALWLIARAKHPDKVPTRLIYVVDRRTVVDQATDLAMWLIQRPLPRWMHDAFGGEPPAVSTLRGQLADNREWSRDPTRPAIIIGTVDLIGSALLFAGYRSSHKRRPLEAGLLGVDSLLVLDEAHLSKPFEKLLTSIEAFNLRGKGVPTVKPLNVIRMSATSSGDHSEPFGLEDSDRSDPIINERCTATKTLELESTDDVVNAIAAAAGPLASGHPGSRIVIFVRTPKLVDDVRKALVKMDKSRETKIAMLTGTMRGLERDELVDGSNPVVNRFLDGNEKPGDNDNPVFLISTSAGEVGFDLNADHMVCDATTIDSFIQRLGRVNRRGYGDAKVVLVLPTALPDKTDLDKACKATVALLTDGMPLSPMNIATLKSGEWSNTDAGQTRTRYELACSPEPDTVPLTDILLDAWSMTSITDRMPGRPPVGPWLRGLDEDAPQTAIAWRAELDLPGFAELDLDDIDEWFDHHRVLTHETLTVPTTVAAKWFVDRWDTLDDDAKSRLGNRVAFTDRGGLTKLTLDDFYKQLSRKSADSNALVRHADLILPASFGGIRTGVGLLDATEPKLDKEQDKLSPDEKRDALQKLLNAIDVADSRGRYREVVTTTDDEPKTQPLGIDSTKPIKLAVLRLTLESDDDRTVRLVSYVPRRERPDLGPSKSETLAEHVGKVRAAIDQFLDRLRLPDDIKRAAQLAADYHDHGKNRERWQALVGGAATPSGQDWLDETLGKSGGDMKRDSRRYRHEFGSLREFTDAVQGKVSEDIFDLAAHLIATHHGKARPHFPKGGFDPDDESRSDDIHTAAVQRFARLQRKYGHWTLAWLENLLRCADAMASAESGSDTNEDQGGES
jgi:CRISPR-associated endonuclease/helicase Cas3